MDWLMTPLSGAAEHHIAPWAYWHARCMALAWGLLLPLGALVARFYKVTPTQAWPRELDNRWWWHMHRGLQYSGVAVFSLGLYLVWGEGLGSSDAARWHAGCGWALCVAAGAQVVGAWLRGSKGGPTEPQMRGDHYDMTPWRLMFERLHKSLGWLLLLASAAVIVLGLVVVDAPRWMPLVLCIWWLALTAAFVVLQRRGRCIDTYQAIWGPDPRHPGNQILPIGWGVKRAVGKVTWPT